MCNTNARHRLVDGAYNERREACERAVAHFAAALPHPVAALRDVTWDEWQKNKAGLDEETARRAAHPIGENERVLAGIEMLRNRNLAGFGKLMFESHESSRRYFENSCPELDTLVDAAAATPGVLGARLSGGGFGGSVVALVRPVDAESAAAALRNVYGRKYGVRCDTRIIACSAGARLLSPSGADVSG
jgi:galactokinase